MTGVEDADVSYESGRAVVTFDRRVTSPAEFIAELERLTGFTASVVDGTGAEGATSPSDPHVPGRR